MTRFLVDCFGGDNPPAILRGVSMFKNGCPDAQVILVGNREQIFLTCHENDIRLRNVEIINCEDHITGEDKPTEVLKAERNLSMTVGLNALVEKKADVFVSSGNSGALLVGTSLIVKRMPNVRRIAFATVIPKFKGQFLFLDSGANSDCQADMLEQFAKMSFEYAQKTMQISNPKLGLLNIGTESHKGDLLRKQAFNLLESNREINFIGNVEPNSVFFNDCDILISDGFCGNIFLKTIEGMVKIYMKLMQNDEKLIDFLETQDHVYLNPKKFAEESYSILLGARLPVIKLHSSVDGNGVFNFLMSYRI